MINFIYLHNELRKRMQNTHSNKAVLIYTAAIISVLTAKMIKLSLSFYNSIKIFSIGQTELMIECVTKRHSSNLLQLKLTMEKTDNTFE